MSQQFPPDRVLVEYRPVQHVTFDLKPPTPPPPPISIVQSNTHGTDGGPTYVQAYASNVTLGNFLVVCAAADSYTVGNPTSSVSDTLGLTWTGLPFAEQGGTGYGWQYFTATATSGGADTVTVTLPGSGSFNRCVVVEVAGVTAVNQHHNGGALSYPLSSGNMTTAATASLVLGWGGSNSGLSTPGTGFTVIQNPGGSLLEYQIESAAGTFAATYPGDGASSAWGVAGAILA